MKKNSIASEPSISEIAAINEIAFAALSVSRDALAFEDLSLVKSNIFLKNCRRFFILFSLSLTLFLISCGGGGGSSSSPSLPSPTSTSNSSTSTPPPPPPPPPPPDKTTFETREYDNQYGLSLINASTAYSRGATGKDALIGIMDTGVDFNHQELDGIAKFTSDSIFDYQERSPTTDEKRHGTHVSGIAAGEKDGTGMHGVAFDANIFFIAVELSSAPEEYEPAVIDSTVDYSGLDNFWSYAEGLFIQKGVTVVNGSFSFQGNINDYTENALRTSFPKTIQTLAQANVRDADKTIFVWSAGNGGAYADQGVDFSSPEVFGGMAHLLPELQTHSVAVVSVDASGEISWFSSHCGVTRDYCLAAPGELIESAYSQDFPMNNDYETFSGTSMAAPHVSGAIALLADYFRGQLGNTEILNRLFLTANKSGVYEDASIYGQGLIDLDAATKPVGTTSVITLNGQESHTNFSTNLKNIGPAIGDGWLTALQGKELVVFDQLGAPFFHPLSEKYSNNHSSLRWLSEMQSNSFKRVNESQTNVSANTSLFLGVAVNHYGEHNFSMSLWPKNDKKLRYFSLKNETSPGTYYFIGTGLSPAFYFGDRSNFNDSLVNYVKYQSPYLEMVNAGSFIGAGKSLSEGKVLSGSLFTGVPRTNKTFDMNQEKTKGLIVEYKLVSEGSYLSFQSGFLKEDAFILGSSFTGAFGSLNSSNTYFKGFSSFMNFKKLNVLASYFHGETKPRLHSTGLITKLENFSSSSYGLGLQLEKIFSSQDRFSFNLSQPLRLTRGGASFFIPTGRTRYKDIIFENFYKDISPSGTEIDLELVYETPLLGGTFYSRFNIFKERGHLEINKIDHFFETRWEMPLN